jgi:small subunit ribosomal protein S4
MGDPRRLRNKSERPKKLWDADRLTEEKALKLEYGLRNMRELWMATAELKKYRREARRLLSVTEEQRRDDVVKVLSKLARFGMLREGATIDEVLSLEVRSVLERRLQTIVLRKGLARTMAQSRQLITHRFIMVNGSTVTRPNYLIKLSDEVAHSKPIDITVKVSEPEKPAAAAPEKSAEAAEPAKKEAASA